MGSMDYVLKPVDYEEMDRILTQAKLRIEKRIENRLVNRTDNIAEY